jgi:hypothetical protein
MTRNINITDTDPSSTAIKFFNDLKDKKHEQIKKLTKNPECIFTVKV